MVETTPTGECDDSRGVHEDRTFRHWHGHFELKRNAEPTNQYCVAKTAFARSEGQRWVYQRLGRSVYTHLYTASRRYRHGFNADIGQLGLRFRRPAPHRCPHALRWTICTRPQLVTRSRGPWGLVTQPTLWRDGLAMGPGHPTVG